jgi:hypothetical protein
MKNELLGLIFIIFLTTFAIPDPMGLGSIRYDEQDPEDWFLHTNVDNRQNDQDLEGLKVDAFFPDLGIMMHSNSIDLDAEEVKALRTFWDNEIPAGEHMVRVCAHNDDVRECAYRYIDFI